MRKFVALLIILLLVTVWFLKPVDSAKLSLLPGFQGPRDGVDKNLDKIESNFNSVFIQTEFQKQLDRGLQTELVQNEALELFQNGKSFEQYLNVIHHAEKFLYLNLLTLDCDEASEPIMRAIEEKSRNGVKVRLITHSWFAVLSQSCLKRLESSGVEVLRTKTHSSYILNDKSELLIGSQVLARMFLLSDGFNNLDRDMMIFAKGPVATDAWKDFVSTWHEEYVDNASFETELSELAKQVELEQKNGLRNINYIKLQPSKLCRFIASQPRQGIFDTQTFWQSAIQRAEKKITFSGVRVEIQDGDLGIKLKEKSRNGVLVDYIGNGYLSGNGELTMVLSEWQQYLVEQGWNFLAKVLEKLNDKIRILFAQEMDGLYRVLLRNSTVKTYTYFNFIHYKVWSFDSSMFYIGSANLDETKFHKVNEAGLACWDKGIQNQLDSELSRDKKNSVLFNPESK